MSGDEIREWANEVRMERDGECTAKALEDVANEIDRLTAELAVERARVAVLQRLLSAWMEFYGADGMESEDIIAARAAICPEETRDER